MAETQKEIQSMGEKEADKIALQPPDRQQKVEPDHIQDVCQDVEPDGHVLLAQAFGHGIGNGIAVEHRGQGRKEPQKIPCLRVAVEP